MNTAGSDRNLLFGILALQMDFISRDKLVAAMHAWVLDKSKGIGEILVAQGVLTPQRLTLLQSLVDEHVRQHDNDLHKSIHAADPAGLPREALAAIADPDLNASLIGIDRAPVPALGPSVAATVAYQPTGRERYTLNRLHAQGGYGQVWVAHDSDIGRDVALKELISKQAESPAIQARFLEEAKITGQLEHPGIVPVYELFHAPATGGAQPAPGSYYTMRFVKGRTLSSAVREYHQKRTEGTVGPLDLRALIGALVSVCNAVAYAHSRGVIHRDLKGANIVLGGFGEVVVLDWGLAKVRDASEPAQSQHPASAAAARAPAEQDARLESRKTVRLPAGLGSVTHRDVEPVSVPREASRDQTLQGQVLGTPAYMPPEQAEGRLDLVDERSDVYGLGAVLYEILTGRPPFDAASAVEILSAVLEQVPDRPRSRVPEIAPALEAICMKAIAKKRDERYASATELAQDLQHWLADEPVTAYREPFAVRAGRWARRHKTFVVGATALLSTAVIALSLSTILIGKEQNRTEQARQLAQENFEDAEAQRQRALESFRQARQAVDDYLTKVSESKLLNVPGLQPLRKELLESAREYYLNFLQQRADDPSLSGELGKTYFRVGLITNDIGSKPEALSAYQKARDLQESLLRDHPDDSLVQRELAETCWHMAELQRWTSQHAAALQSYDRSRELRERLVHDHGEDPNHRSGLAKSHAGLGDLYVFTDRRQEAIPEFERARDIGEAIVRGHPEIEQFQRDLADSCRRLGEVQTWFERYDTALECLQRARELLLGLTSRDLPVADDQYYLAWTHCKIAGCERIVRNLPAALESCTTARGIFQSIVAANPSVAEYRNGLASCHLQLGYLYRASKELTDSLQSFQQCCEELERAAHDHPAVSVYQLNLFHASLSLARAHSMLGQHAEAIAVHERARDRLEKLTFDQPMVSEYQLALAKSLYELGLAHWVASDSSEASNSFRRSFEVMDRLVRAHPTRPSYLNLLAWYLSTCPNAQLRDPPRALATATQLVEMEPSPNSLNTLGVAQFRAGLWKEAVDTLEKVIALRGAVSTDDYFFLAMAQHQLGDDEHARQSYAKATAAMKQSPPDGEEPALFQAEAAATLGETIQPN
jgi:serine/threonine protein kinase/tetratricopeptide (TPR) repeat protein